MLWVGDNVRLRSMTSCMEEGRATGSPIGVKLEDEESEPSATESWDRRRGLRDEAELEKLLGPV